MLQQPKWTDALGWALLASLPEETLVAQWGPIPADTARPPGLPGDPLRQNLMNWARQDEEVRRWTVAAWREAHPDVVEAADQAVIEGWAEDAVRALAAFPPEDAVLALLTDEFDEGQALARAFVSQVDDDAQRRAVVGVLERLVGDGGRATRRRLRVVVIGGRQRFETTLGQRYLDDSAFEVRWRAFEKKAGSGAVEKEVASVLRNADAAIIITGMASHMLVQFARDSAQRFGLRWRCVEKASDLQLKAALHEMFPEVAAAQDAASDQ